MANFRVELRECVDGDDQSLAPAGSWHFDSRQEAITKAGELNLSDQDGVIRYGAVVYLSLATGGHDVHPPKAIAGTVQVEPDRS